MQQAQAEKAQLLAELQSLQAQIEPHFLFNTLATLRSMVRQKSPAALTLLDRISEFLETVLPRVRDGHSTLGRELNIVQQYLSIMQLRLGSRLRFDVDTAKLPLDIAMPSLLLQPLVENAIAHGIEPSECGGEIRVTAERIGRLLKIRVFNTGTPLGDSTQQHGMALKNLAERLQVLYDDDASFELLSNSDGTAAVLTFPVSP